MRAPRRVLQVGRRARRPAAANEALSSGRGAGRSATLGARHRGSRAGRFGAVRAGDEGRLAAARRVKVVVRASALPVRRRLFHFTTPIDTRPCRVRLNDKVSGPPYGGRDSACKRKECCEKGREGVSCPPAAVCAPTGSDARNTSWVRDCGKPIGRSGIPRSGVFARPMAEKQNMCGMLLGENNQLQNGGMRYIW